MGEQAERVKLKQLQVNTTRQTFEYTFAGHSYSDYLMSAITEKLAVDDRGVEQGSIKIEYLFGKRDSRSPYAVHLNKGRESGDDAFTRVTGTYQAIVKAPTSQFGERIEVGGSQWLSSDLMKQPALYVYGHLSLSQAKTIAKDWETDWQSINPYVVNARLIYGYWRYSKSNNMHYLEESCENDDHPEQRFKMTQLKIIHDKMSLG